MSSQTFTLGLAQPEDVKEIANFINTNFFLDVPLIRMFGIEEVPPVLVRKDKLDEHIAFTVKATSPEDHIIGVAVVRSKEEEWPITEDTDARTAQFVTFVNFIDKDAKLDSLPEKTLELYILSVAPSWRGQGVGRSLGEASVQTARQRGYDMLKIFCANEFTAYIARSLGFREFYKMAYSDYARTWGVAMLSFPPHHHVYYYVKDLNE